MPECQHSYEILDISYKKQNLGYIETIQNTYLYMRVTHIYCKKCLKEGTLEKFEKSNNKPIWYRENK